MTEFLVNLSWVAVLEIVAIDILLGGDNAVVIALACRGLAPAQRRLGILWGTAGAIALRVVLIFFALSLLQVSGLKLAGAVLLLWIGVKLLASESQSGHDDVASSSRLWAAVKTIIVADLVMSLDNVVAIASAAETAPPGQQLALVIFGLVVSIPLIVWGSQFVIRLMDRFPMVITAGGMLLGWIAGSMGITDPLLEDWVVSEAAAKPGGTGTVAALWRYLAGAIGAFFVLGVGLFFKPRAAAASA